MQIMKLVEKDIRPRDIMTEAAFHNAETVDMALGCSTNTMLHLPAIAHEAGVDISFDMANEISSTNGELMPSQMFEMTMQAHKFLFQSQLTSNVANRTSDGVQQLFRQQS